MTNKRQFFLHNDGKDLDTNRKCTRGYANEICHFRDSIDFIFNNSSNFFIKNFVGHLNVKPLPSTKRTDDLTTLFLFFKIFFFFNFFKILLNVNRLNDLKYN